MKITRLVWNDWNINHIARHRVQPYEVKEVIVNQPLFLEGKKGRLIALGQTNLGRILTIVLDPEPKKSHFYPVTARPASKKDRRLLKSVGDKK